MIVVKVQLSLATNQSSRQILVYNQDRSVRYEGDAPPDLVRAINGRAKMFCLAKLVNGELELSPADKVPDPGW